ncbi:MAG TPA: flavin reductase family protein [Pseudolabrys sp.]|jgi:flavin reductase|nr:flavin reductase family protein [Pseudolabrys sp.]
MLPALPQDRVFDASARCVPAIEFRNALSRLATAVSVVTTDGPAGTAGVTCSAVCALSDEPAMVLVCVHGKSATNTAIKSNRNLCVNCLQSGQSDLSQAFAGVGGMPMPQRFALSTWDSLVTGAPRCREALVALDCEVAEVRDVGTHSIFVAKVLATAETSTGEPLLYQRRAYVTTCAL